MYKIPTVILAVVLIGGVGGCAAPSSTEGASSPSKAASTPTDDASKAPVADGPTKKFPMQDGDWRLESVRIKDDGLGDFGGSARVTYTGSAKEGTNIFTITLFKGPTKDIATLQGSAMSVKPNGTVSVQLISQDTFKKGPYKYDFQNDM